MLATLGMGMKLRDASIVILLFSLLTCIPPAFMGISGMETGLRQLVVARYSFGYVNKHHRPSRPLPPRPANIHHFLLTLSSPASISSRSPSSSTPPP